MWSPLDGVKERQAKKQEDRDRENIVPEELSLPASVTTVIYLRNLCKTKGLAVLGDI